VGEDTSGSVVRTLPALNITALTTHVEGWIGVEEILKYNAPVNVIGALVADNA
jgi:hypothetical protein